MVKIGAMMHHQLGQLHSSERRAHSPRAKHAAATSHETQRQSMLGGIPIALQPLRLGAAVLDIVAMDVDAVMQAYIDNGQPDRVSRPVCITPS
jgi:hypothetical protein